MRLADLTCRLCNNTYAVVTGCEVCLPAKEQMVTPEFDGAIDAHSLSKQGAKIIGMLLDRLEYDISKADLKSFYPNWAKDASLLSRALATLLNEIRKFEVQGALDAAKLTYEDKRQLFKQWVEGLPLEQKRFIATELAPLLSWDALGFSPPALGPAN